MKPLLLQVFQLTAFILQVVLLVSALGGHFYLVFQVFLEPDSFMLAASLAEMIVLVALMFKMLAWARTKALAVLPTDSILARLQFPSDLRVIYFAIIVAQLALMTGFSVFSAAMSEGNKGPGKRPGWTVFYDWLGYLACFLLLYWALSKARSRLSYLSAPARRLTDSQLPATP